jgi:hypothetical protein
MTENPPVHVPDPLKPYVDAYEARRRVHGAVTAASVAAAVVEGLAAVAAAPQLTSAQRTSFARFVIDAEVARQPRPLDRAALAAICDAAPPDLAAAMHATLDAQWPAVLDGWALEAILGRGGFGTVYRARHHDGRVCALKRLRDHCDPEPPLAVRHPRLLVPTWQQTADDQWYGLMPLVEGESLAARLARDHRLPVSEALQVVDDLLDLLEALHPYGYHRDLKPANLLRDASGALYLADFGLAVPRSERHHAFSKVMAGTAAYMAPEVLSLAREAPGARWAVPALTVAADLWSVGVVLYELLTGAAPYGRSEDEVYANALAGRYDGLRALRPEVPVALATLCQQCLQTDPARRPASARDLRRALEAVREASTPPALPPGFEAWYGGSAGAPAPFGGRTAELSVLHDWLATGPEPCMLLTAPMGRGKSALLYHFVGEVRRAGLWDVVFVPINLLAGSASPTVFLRDLVRHLNLRQDRDLPAQADVLEWTRRWQEGLQAEHARGRQLLIVVDGLDEALDGWTPDASFLPVPPAGSAVRILAAARDAEDGARWRQRLGWTAPTQARRLTLGRLDGPGLLAVFASLGQPLDALPEPAAWTRELLRVTEGEPLLARLYAVEVWHGQQQTPRVPLTLAALAARAPGLDGLVEAWWTDQQRLWGGRGTAEEQRAREVLDLLSVAQGPLTVDDLAALRETGPGPVRDALRAAQRFLVGQGTVASPVALGHPRLIEFFTERLQVPAPEVHGRFARWGQRVVAELNAGTRAPQAVPRYLPSALRHHLLASGASITEYDALLALPWVEASMKATGSYDAVLADVDATQAALVAASANDDGPGTPRELVRLVRSALIAGSVHGRAGKVPPALAVRAWQTGHWSLARVLAHLDMRADAELSHDVAAALARAVAEEGEAALERALHLRLPSILTGHLMNALQRMAPWRVADVLPNTVQALAPYNFEDTTRFLSTLAGPALRASVRLLAPDSLFADALQRRSLPPLLHVDVLDLVAAMPDDWYRYRVLAACAPYLVEPQMSRALGVAEALEGDLRFGALITLASRLPAPLLPRALKAVELPPEEWTALWHTKEAAVLAALAPRLPTNLLGKVLARAQDLPDDWHQSRARVLLAVAPHLTPNQRKRARVLAESLKIESDRIAATLALAGQLTPELLSQVFESRVIWGEGRVAVLSALAPRLTKELQSEVLATARHLPIAELNEVITALAPTLADELLAQALAIIEESTDTSRGVVLDLIIALAPRLTSGLVPRALATVEAIHDGAPRASLLLALARRQPSTLVPKALAAAKALHDDLDRARALTSLAPHLPAELLPEALRAAETFRGSMFHESFLISLVPHLSSELLRQALSAAELVVDEDARMRVLVALVPLGPDELLQRVLDDVRTIDDDHVRATVLASLVPFRPGDLATALAAVDLLREEERAAILMSVATSWPEELLQYVLDAAEQIPDELKRARVLRVLAPRLSRDLLRRVLRAAESLGDSHVQALSRGVFAPYRRGTPWSPEAQHESEVRQIEHLRAQILANLVPHISDVLLVGALDTVSALRDTNDRVQILIPLAARLPKTLLPRVLDMTRALDDAGRAEVLSALIPLDPAQLLPLAISAVEAAQIDNRARARALLAIAPWLSASSITRGLDAAMMIRGDLATQCIALSALVPLLSPQLQSRMLKELETSGASPALDCRIAARVLGALVPARSAEGSERVSNVLSRWSKVGRNGDEGATATERGKCPTILFWALPMMQLEVPGRMPLMVRQLQASARNGRSEVLEWVGSAFAEEGLWPLRIEQALELAATIEEVGRHWR